jgi:hypothetical protein
VGKERGGTGMVAGIGDGSESDMGEGLRISAPWLYSEPFRFKVGRLGLEASLFSTGFLGI